MGSFRAELDRLTRQFISGVVEVAQDVDGVAELGDGRGRLVEPVELLADGSGLKARPRQGRQATLGADARRLRALRGRQVASIERLLATREKNVYTIEKNGIKKMIYQSPWYRNGEYAGFVEFSFELPFEELPHFVRA